MPVELLLDPQIRGWVILPIVVLSFLEGVLCHYITYLLTAAKKIDMQQVEDTQAIMRARVLREFGHLLPRKSFLMRRNFFTANDTGYFTKCRLREPSMQNPITDPTIASDLLKGNIANIIPMVIGGGWINSMFSGFVATKVPFPLVLRFKPMLQRGIDLDSLSASWVSSVSWYFLSVFGIRSVSLLILSGDGVDEGDMTASAALAAPMELPVDPKVQFKAEWESLEMIEHNWKLASL